MTQQAQREITVQDLEAMKNNVDRGKEILGKAEGKLENLHQQKDNLTAQIKELGVEPENLDSEIEQLNNQISDIFERAQALIPHELINRR